MAKIKADQLTREVQTMLYAHTHDATMNFYDEAQRIARKGARKLRAESRRQFGKGEYSEGWKVDSKGNRHRQITWSHTIYNEHYAITHLLENGHVTANGMGRYHPDTPAHVHIQPIHDELIQEYEAYLSEWF